TLSTASTTLSLHSPSLLFYLLTPRPPTPTLFPYTTLFRSRTYPSSHRCREHRSRSVSRWKRFGAIEGTTTSAPPSCGQNGMRWRSEEHTSELQSLAYLVCRLLLEKKKKIKQSITQ